MPEATLTKPAPRQASPASQDTSVGPTPEKRQPAVGTPLFLQRQSLRSNPTAVIQTKLLVNQPGDQFELEADAAAQRAVQNDEADVEPPSHLKAHDRVVQRSCAPCATDTITSRRQEINEGIIEPPDSGSPLSDTIRHRAEPVLGADLSSVRVHASPSAHDTADALNAKAFTNGDHIWLGAGESPEDVELMTHESTHVIQQSQRGDQTKLIQRKETVAQIGDEEDEARQTVGREIELSPGQDVEQIEQRVPTVPQTPVPALKTSDAAGELSTSQAPTLSVAQPATALSEEPGVSEVVGSPPLAALLGSTEPISVPPTTVSQGPEDSGLTTGQGPQIPATAKHALSTPSATLDQSPRAFEAATEPVPEQTPGFAGSQLAPPDDQAGETLDGVANLAPSIASSAITVFPPPEVATVPSDDVSRIPAPTEQVAAAAFGRILAAATAEKEAAERAFDAKRAEIISSVATAVQSIQADGLERTQQIESELQQKEQEVCGRLSAARIAITAARDAQCAAAQADELIAVTDLQQAIDDKRRAAMDASNQEAEAIQTAGRAQADHALAIVSSTNSAVDTAANQAVSGANAPDDQVRSEVQTKVGESSGAIKGDAREKGDNVARGAIETGETVARGIREAGAQLAGSIDQGAGEVERSIHESTASVVEQIEQQAEESLARLQQGESAFAAGLADARAQILPGIQSATEEAVQRMQQVGEQAVIGLEAGRASTIAGFDQASAHVLDQLSAAEDDVLSEDVQEFERQATGLFVQLHDEISTNLDDQVARIGTGIDQATNGFSDVLEQQQNEICQRVDNALGEIGDIEQWPQSFVERCQEGREQLQQQRQQGIQQWGTQADGKINEARAGWTQQRETAENEVSRRVAEFQTQTGQVTQNAPGQFRNAATQAVASASASLASRIWAGIKEGFRRFFDGMKWFLLAFLAVFVVVVAIMAVIAGGITVAVIAAAAALALTIVGIGFLIKGLIDSAIHRIGQWMAAPQPWWAKIVAIPYLLAVIVGDVFGVTPFLEGLFGYDAISLEELSTEERWARGTQGVLTGLSIFLLRRAGKAAGARGKGWRGSGKPPVEPPVNTPGAVDTSVPGPKTLTPSELAELQAIADRYNTPLDVVGSRARGEGRNIANPELPTGKGEGMRSDIDVRIDGQADIDSGGRLSNDVSNVSRGAGNIVSSGLPEAPSEPPVIRIRPKAAAPQTPRSGPSASEPSARTPSRLVSDADPTPRAGETTEQARARSEAARAEQARRGYCFVAGTAVQTPNGPIPIEVIAPGQLVLAQGEDRTVGNYRVLNCSRSSIFTLFNVQVAGTLTLTTTRNHAFFVVGKGWTIAKNLAVADNLLALDGRALPVTAINRQRTATPMSVFNLEVETAHSYFVGHSLSVWVHNGGPDDPVYSGNLFWGLGASGPRQRLPRTADPNNPDPKLRSPHPGDPDGASAWRTASPDEVARFLGARASEGGTGNHGAITEAQLAEVGLVAVVTPGTGAAAAAGLQHVSIRPAANPDPQVPLTDAEMAEVKAKLETITPAAKGKAKDFGCG